MLRLMWIFAGFSGAVAVMMGAAGAHWLQGVLDAEGIGRLEKAAAYQMYHSLALLGVAALRAHAPDRMLDVAGGLFMLGILCFSGSLYLYGFMPVRGLMFITPVGGVAWIAGWICLMLAGVRKGAGRA